MTTNSKQQTANGRQKKKRNQKNAQTGKKEESMSYSKELIASLEAKGQLLRKDCIKCIGVGVAGHVGGSCSSADIMAALYFYKMKYDCKNPEQNPVPRWMGYYGKSDKSSVELDPVEQFKQNPDSFFPEFTKKK